MMRILVCGGRDFTDKDKLFRRLDEIHAEHTITKLVEGGQRTRDPDTGEIIGGADYWGNQWARSRNIGEIATVRANWRDYGNAAGPMRNTAMLRDHPCDAVLAAPGNSGTHDMVAKARAAGVAVWPL